jgi:hypothetical protein
MQFIRGNLALRDHRENGQRVFLFESLGGGTVRFACEVEVFDADYFETPDSLGTMRTGIKFFFKRLGAYLPYQPTLFDPLESVAAEPKWIYGLPPETARPGFVTTRVGQGAYRKRIIHRWEYECAVTKFDKLDILVASHIVPWAQANDFERLDVDNGILLSPVYDALFDRQLVTFENSGGIVLSTKIEPAAYEKIGVTGKERISKLKQSNLIYLEQHQKMFQSKQG